MIVMEFENREAYDLNHTSQLLVVAEMQSEDTEKISSPLVESLKALEAAIQGLYRLGLAIRQSSTANLTQRITAFIEKIDGGSTEELFFFRLKMKLIDEPRREGRPGASLTLCKQLASSIAFRYFRIQYRISHQRKLETPRKPQPASGATFETSEGTVNMSEQISEKGSRKPLPYRVNQLISDMSVTEPTIPDSSIAFRKYESLSPASTTTTSASMASVQLRDATYPDPPLETAVVCPYCAQPVLAALRKSKRDWERHVDNDLEPYTCISEDCVEPPQLFSRYEAWAKHMEDKHSSRWTELVHKPTSWCCDTDHEEQYFEVESEFDEHVREAHRNCGEEDEIVELKEWCEVRRARPPYTCPICGCVPEDIATVAPWAIQQPSAKQDPQPDQGSGYSQADLRACLLRHIAAHLKTVSFMSIIYLDDEEDVPQPHSVGFEEADNNNSLTNGEQDLGQIGGSNEEIPSSSVVFSHNNTSRMDYTEICRDIRSQFTIKFKKAETKDKFATRGMVRDILSRSMLGMLYKSIYDDGPDAINADRFVRSIERKMLHDFLAVLLYAKCSINAAKVFTKELVFGNMAQEHQRYSETPYLLPATEVYLANLFDHFDAQDFFVEQRPFCTIVLGGPGVVTIDQDDKRSLPWLDERYLGSGAFGSVYEVKIPRDHLTKHRDFNQTIKTSELVARKDYKPAKDMEESFEKEVRSIREIFSGSSKHNNILESFGTLVIKGPEPKFSLLMPLAQMDLQKYMEGTPEISPDDRWARERIISAAIGLAGGLDFLHSKMTTVGGDRLVCYHMDLKPSNILVFLHKPRLERTSTEDRDYGMIWKLSDFGLSRVKTKTTPEKKLDSLFERKLIDQSSQASPTQNPRGNGTYMPNEALDKGKTMDHKSDIWSLGCIISVLFTYMEEGYSALERYSNSRRKHNKYNKTFDVFYQENRSIRGADLNEAVKAQHSKLIEAAKKRKAAEGEAVSSILSAFTNGFRKERSTVPVDIHRWRLDIDKSTRFKDCRSSPDGQLIAYWSDRDIMVFDRATTFSRTNSSSTFGTTSRATSIEDVRDRALRNVGKHRLAGVSCSWKSLGLTDSYLVAATTETKSLECYVFDIKLDQTLRTYSKISLPYSGFYSLTVSPNQNAMACILSNNDRASLFTAVIDTNLSEPSTPSASLFSETSSRQDYQDAGIRLSQRKLLDLNCSTSSVEHIALRTEDEGYIIIRSSASTLSLCLFTIRQPRLVKQDLKLGSPTSSVERLFTDMVSFRSEANEAQSEVLVVAQAQRIFHLKFTSAEEAASSVAYLSVEHYRLLKIATNGQVVVALGAHSGSSHLFLLEVKLSSPRVRPGLLQIAELKEVSTSCQAKLSVIGDWSEPIALITTASPDGQYRVYHKSLISLAYHNT
ncbi:hypothetical protein H9Q74_010283 [Fusarium xylarioides]|nr:hypothetical protein H9Q71_010653 [Fusarium xylarioides]KAG5817996.1 hypothetical protein H9Q74_010283 [Fusarium xylarioides]